MGQRCEDKLYLAIPSDSFEKPILFLLIFFICYSFKINVFVYVCVHTCKSQGVYKALRIPCRAKQGVPALMCLQLDNVVMSFPGVLSTRSYTHISYVFLSAVIGPARSALQHLSSWPVLGS